MDITMSKVADFNTDVFQIEWGSVSQTKGLRSIKSFLPGIHNSIPVMFLGIFLWD